MSTKALLDPEVLPALDAFPDISLEAEALPRIRQAAAKNIELVDPDDFQIAREEVLVPQYHAEGPPVRCLVYRPKQRENISGAYLHFHGGGFLMGSPEEADKLNAVIATKLGIVVVSVDYRLAPEHTAPAAIEDAYSALAWLHENAPDLGIDPRRIAVGGESAGGGVAAALAQYAHSKGNYPICHQFLTYPMLDSRTGSDEQPGDPLTGQLVWTRERNQLAWSYYLGPTPAAAPYVPALLADLTGLPPAWISTASHDLFRDENIEYAQRLLAAGSQAELMIYPGTCHGYQWATKAPVTRRYIRDHLEALARVLSK